MLPPCQEKKKLLKAAEQKQRGLEYDEALMKASAEGAQFACSQTIIDPNDLQWANSLDVNIPSVSISAHNKVGDKPAMMEIRVIMSYGYTGIVRGHRASHSAWEKVRTGGTEW